jgi:hypothetical protein
MESTVHMCASTVPRKRGIALRTLTVLVTLVVNPEIAHHRKYCSACGTVHLSTVHSAALFETATVHNFAPGNVHDSTVHMNSDDVAWLVEYPGRITVHMY